MDLANKEPVGIGSSPSAAENDCNCLTAVVRKQVLGKATTLVARER
jgi:hypothetical protein